MYKGSDGQQYNSRYDAFGKEPTIMELQRQKGIGFNKQLRDDLAQQRNGALDRAVKREELEELQRNNFYNGAQQFANIHGRNSQPASGFGPQQSRSRKSAGGQQVTGGGSTNTGQPGNPDTRTKHDFDNQLVQDAGKLSRLLDGFNQTGESEELMKFINSHPKIGVNNASGIDMDDKGNVSIFADGEEKPVKSFNVNALRNLNNYGVKRQQQYDAGNKVNDMSKVHESGMSSSEMKALAETAGMSSKDQQKNLPQAQARYYQEYMKQYGPRAAGYRDTSVSQPYRTQGFNVFGEQQPEVGSWQDEMRNRMGGSNNGGPKTPPPPPPTPPPGGTQPVTSNGPGTPPPASQYYPHQPYGR